MGLMDAKYSSLRDSRYLVSLRALLPPGKAFNRRDGSTLTKFLRGLSYEAFRTERRGRDLLDEADPRTTRELLPTWEALVGLPDCAPLASTSVGRRASVVAKLTSNAAPTPERFRQIAAQYGATILLVERPLAGFTCVSPCNAALHAGQSVFVWDVFGPDDPNLICALEREVPPHTLMRYTVLALPAGFIGHWVGEDYTEGDWAPRGGVGAPLLEQNGPLRGDRDPLLGEQPTVRLAADAGFRLSPARLLSDPFRNRSWDAQTWTVAIAFARTVEDSSYGLFTVRDSAVAINNSGPKWALRAYTRGAPVGASLRGGLNTAFRDEWGTLDAGSGPLATDRGHVVVASWHGPSNTMTVRLDGATHSAVVNAPSGGQTTDRWIALGLSAWGTSNLDLGFSGSIGEFALWDRALTAGEHVQAQRFLAARYGLPMESP